MKIFGNQPAPSWFAHQVRVNLNQPSGDEKVIQKMKDFIVQQAAKYNLTIEELNLDLLRLGIREDIAKSIMDDFSSNKDQLRKDILEAAKANSSVHARVMSSELRDESTFMIRIGRDEPTMILDVSEHKQELADALKSALAAFDSYS